MSVLAPLVVILGPTASGKSSLAIHLAQQLNGEVLVCDSTQVYRHFDIGTAKVPLAEQEGIAHHLVDLVEPEELFTAGEYRRRALLVLAEVTKRGKLPILTAVDADKRAVADRLAAAYRVPTLATSLTRNKPNYFSVWKLKPTTRFVTRTP